MKHIDCTLGETDIHITAAHVRVNYHEISHADFNTLIALYKLLGFYKNIDLALAPEETEKLSAPEEALNEQL